MELLNITGLGGMIVVCAIVWCYVVVVVIIIARSLVLPVCLREIPVDKASSAGTTRS